MGNALKDMIIRRIEATGPITLADYMNECLIHPKHGYYTQKKVFGRKGDFITAPEISNMFGEIMALWLIDRYYALGSPSSFNLVEFGPGRGVLMQDILHTAKIVPEFISAASVHFVEASEQLQAEQKKRVPNATWHKDQTTLPESGASLFIANEFFDALPIHQFIKEKGIWLERRIIAQGNALKFAITQGSAMTNLIPERVQAADNGSIAEVCPRALTFTGDIATHINTHGGAAIFIDYGHTRSAAGDTFQAVKAHEYTDPLTDPGMADLTAHVDFEQIAIAAGEKNTQSYGAIEQGQFLMNMGIGNRAMQLANTKGDEDKAKILLDLKRLTAPQEMGKLFKVMCIQSTTLPDPAGFMGADT